MNNLQRRLFRAFADAGGDLCDDAQVERLIRYVEGRLLLLPPKIREAVEVMWRSPEGAEYRGVAEQLTARAGGLVSVTTFRQRVSRGLRMLEQAIAGRRWDTHVLAPSTAAPPRPPGERVLRR